MKMIEKAPFFREALVVSNRDPKGRERLLVRVPGIHPMDNETVDNAVWANHCAPNRIASGGLPEPDDYVYVMFPDAMDFNFCVWMGVVRFSYQIDPKEDVESFHNEKVSDNEIVDTYNYTEITE